MRKNDNGKKGNIGFILLIILIIGISALFIGALIVQYGVYNGKFPSIASVFKYLFIAFLVALPLLLVLLVLVTK